MAFEHKEGQGSLFKNDKRTADNQPHARGDALIGGVLYEVAAWTKEGAKGKFQSLAFKPKEAKRPSGGGGREESFGRMPSPDMSDEIPFGPEFR